MHFGNLRESVKIGKDRKLKKFRIMSAVVMMTTADGMHPAFSGSHPKLFIFSDLYRVNTDIAEVHADIALSFSKSIVLVLR